MKRIGNWYVVAFHRFSGLKICIEPIIISLVVLAAWINAFEVVKERLVLDIAFGPQKAAHLLLTPSRIPPKGRHFWG